MYIKDSVGYRRLNKKGRFGFTAFQANVIITNFKKLPIIFSNVV